MRYTTGLLAFSLAALAATASQAQSVPKSEYVIYAHCERADLVLSCRIDDQGTHADSWVAVKKQVRCIIGNTPLADELRTALAGNLVSDLASKHLDPDLVYRPPHEQWVRMVVSIPVTDFLKPDTYHGDPLGQFEVGPDTSDSCQELPMNIGWDYGTDAMHMLSAYVR